MNYNIRFAYLEITRKCNLHCAHCMRGPAQNIELSKEDVDLFFEKLKGVTIHTLNLGGGEPTLNPDMIVYIIDKIIKENIPVVSIAMITNGQVFNKDVANAFNRFDLNYKRKLGIRNIAYNSLHSNIAFSADKYHKPIKKEVREAYKKSAPYLNYVDHIVPDDNIIKSGFATFGYEYIHRLIKPKYRILGNDVKVITGLYLTARGEVTTNGEGEYADVDLNNYGHIRDFSFEDFMIENGLPIKGSLSIKEAMGKPRKMIRWGEHGEI